MEGSFEGRNVGVGVEGITVDGASDGMIEGN